MDISQLHKLNASFPVATHLSKLYANRYLIGLWAMYNIKARYARTILGVLWIVILPLSTSAVIAFAFSVVLGAARGGVPVFSFVLAAVVPYNLFSNGILNGTQAIAGRMGIVSQIYFPREVLVIIRLIEGLIDFLFTFVAMILINAVIGIYPNIAYPLLLIPLAILVMLTFGLALITSCLGVIIRDIPQLVAVGMQLFFYLSPVIYPIDAVPASVRDIVALNPLAGILTCFRDIIVYQQIPDFGLLIYPFIVSVLVLVTGYWIFKRVEKNLADYI